MANSNFIVQNGLNIGGATGATISTDPVSGAMYIVPAATTQAPNPVAMVFTTSGTITAVATSGGVANVANIATASNTATTSTSTTFANLILTGNLSMAGVTGYAQIPAGTSAQRPQSPSLGMIRYNSTISSFEGYGAGAAWSSLGGVKSVDGYATITAENYAGAGDDVLRFYSGSTGSSVQVMWASSSNISILPTTAAVSTTTGALQVAGGAGITGNLWVGGSIYANNIVSTTYTNLSVSDPLLYLAAPNPYPYNYDIGMYSHFVGGPANVYAHTGVVRSIASNTWNFFSNVSSEPGGTVNWSDTGLAWDTIKAGNVIPGANVAYNLGSPTAYFGTIYAGQCTVNTVTATSLGGTLTTAGQPNITSVGTLTGLTVSGAIVPNGNVTINLGSTTAWWNNIYGTAVHSLYADLAENYQADKQYNPGTVLQFGGVAEVTVAEADTTRVAGVVSTNPAHLMNGALNGTNVTALALMGRVPCNVIGPVNKGDLMVSAGFGFAKTNNSPVPGQVIGKALQDFLVPGKGVIEIVVGRV